MEKAQHKLEPAICLASRNECLPHLTINGRSEVKEVLILCMIFQGIIKDFTVGQWFSTGSNFTPPRTCGDIGRQFWLLKLGGAAGFWWGEARDSAEHHIVTRQSATTKDHPAQNVNSAAIEKSCTRKTKI